MTGQSVELLGGCRQGWTNGLAEYVLSDDSTFNPNVGATMNGEPLKRR